MFPNYSKIVISFFIIIYSPSMIWAQLSVDISIQEPNCYGYTNGSATAKATGGVGNYTYSWSNGQIAGATVYGIGAGTHSVTVTSGTETVSQTFTMSQPTQLLTQILPVGGICGSPQDTYRVHVMGGTTPYNYEWRELSTNTLIGNQVDLIHPSQNTYILTVKDAQQCARVTPLNITEPMLLNTAATPSSCLPPFNGELVTNVIGGKPPFNYNWNRPQNAGNQSVLNNLMPNIYTVTITDGNGCTKIKAIEVPAINNYELTTWVEGGTTVCKVGELHTLRASTNAPNLRWSDAKGNKIDSTVVSKNQDLIYVATIGDSFCVRRDTIVLTNQAIRVQMDTAMVMCWYDKHVLKMQNLKSQDKLTVAWTPANFINGSNTTLTPMIKGESDGLLKGSFRNQYGCVLDTNVRISGRGRFKSDLVAYKNNKMIDSTTQLLPNDKIQLVAKPNGNNYTYVWAANPTMLLGGLRDSSAAATVKQTTDISVIVRDGFGCIDTLAMSNGVAGKLSKRYEVVTKACNEQSVFLPEAFSPNEDGENDILTVKSVFLDKAIDFEMSIYSRWGQLLFSTQDPNQGWDGKVNGAFLQPDAYMVCMKGQCVDGIAFNRKQLVLLKR
jgi:gliding motility-associated-like protein